MTTTGTVTIGILAGGGFAAAAAIAGALGLGLAALALKSQRGRKNVVHVHPVHHQGQHGGGGHGHGYDHDYRRRRGRYGRKKRAVGEAYAQENDYGAQQDWKDAQERESRMMEVVRAEDSSGCGLKLVCELARQNNEQLTKDHLAILELVGPGLLPGVGPLHPSRHPPILGPKLEYQVARGLGQAGYSCAKLYPTCPVGDVVATLDSILP